MALQPRILATVPHELKAQRALAYSKRLPRELRDSEANSAVLSIHMRIDLGHCTKREDAMGCIVGLVDEGILLRALLLRFRAQFQQLSGNIGIHSYTAKRRCL